MDVIGGVRERSMLHGLTGLRAFAAAWVVLYHFRADIKLLMPRSEPLWPLMDSGYAGVDVFFVLSGFIITYTYLEQLKQPQRAATIRFLGFRLARIYPVHLFTLAIFAFIVTPGAVSGVGPGDLWRNVASTDFVRQVLLVHGWGWDGNRAWNYPAWSISSEWMAYLAFPAVALGLAKVRTLGSAGVGLAAAHAFNLASFLLIAQLGMEGEIIGVRIVGEFLAGCFLLLIWRRGWAADARWDRLTPAFLLASVVGTVAANELGSVAPVLAAPLYCGLIYGLALERDAVSRWLGLRWTVYAGEASYALYMTHAVVQRFVWEYLPAGDYLGSNVAVRAGVLLIYTLLLAAAAVATYEAIEKPSRRIVRRLTLNAIAKVDRGPASATTGPRQA
ncbi:MAG: acyltransferase family protein [Dehalococcoidia bacterium]